MSAAPATDLPFRNGRHHRETTSIPYKLPRQRSGRRVLAGHGRRGVRPAVGIAHDLVVHRAALGHEPRIHKLRVRGAGRSVSHRAAYVVPARSAGLDAAALRLAAAEAIAKGMSGGPLSLRLVAMPYRDREGRSTIPAVLHVGGPTLAAAAQSDLHMYGYAHGRRPRSRLPVRGGHDRPVESRAFGPKRRRSRADGFRRFAGRGRSSFVRTGASGETGSIRRQVQVPAPVEGESCRRRC
jgi:hypothetical protein